MGQYQSLYQYTPSIVLTIPISRLDNFNHYINIHHQYQSPDGSISRQATVPTTATAGRSHLVNNCLNIHVFSKKKRTKLLSATFFHSTFIFHPHSTLISFQIPPQYGQQYPAGQQPQQFQPQVAETECSYFTFPFSNVCPCMQR